MLESAERGASFALLLGACLFTVPGLLMCSDKDRAYSSHDGGSGGMGATGEAGSGGQSGSGGGQTGGAGGTGGGEAGSGGATAGTGGAPPAGGSGGGGNASGTGGGGTGGAAGTGGGGGTGGGNMPCQGAVTSLRLWKLHLGQSDYVTIKNTSDCQIALGGLNVVFDDREDAFPAGTDLDCTVQLPAATLAPQASIRVHEDGRPGDIDALDEAVTVTACGSGVPYNPQRGGVTYLCDGTCSAATVLDVVAHRGYEAAYAAPPAFLFGVTFASPIGGVTDAGQNAMHYRRSGTTGARPNFTGADWALEQRTLYAGFEDGLTVQLSNGTPGAWSQDPGQPADIATSALAAAVGTVSLRIAHTGADGVSTALLTNLTAGINQPREFSYFARVESTSVAAGYFDLLMSPFSAMQLSFKPSGLGAERENGERTETSFAGATWYQIEGREIDYTARRFDLYVNRTLVAARVPFWTNAPFVDQLLLYSVSSGSVAYFDEIELWQ